MPQSALGLTWTLICKRASAHTLVSVEASGRQQEGMGTSSVVTEPQAVALDDEMLPVPPPVETSLSREDSWCAQ